MEKERDVQPIDKKRLVVAIIVCVGIAAATWYLFGEQLWIGATLIIAALIKFFTTLTLKKAVTYVIAALLMRSVALIFWLVQRVLLPVLSVFFLSHAQRNWLNSKISATEARYRRFVARVRLWLDQKPITFGAAIMINALTFLFILYFVGEYFIFAFKVMWEMAWAYAKFLIELIYYGLRSVKNWFMNALFRGYVVGRMKEWVPETWYEKYHAWHQKQLARAERHRRLVCLLWRRWVRRIRRFRAIKKATS